MEQSPSGAFNDSPSSGCNAHLTEHIEVCHLEPALSHEPTPVPCNKLLIVAPWRKGCKVAGDARYAHLQANTQPVIVACKSIYSSPDAEKFGCAGGRCTVFPSIPLSLKAFSCATHAYCAPAAGFAIQKKAKQQLLKETLRG